MSPFLAVDSGTDSIAGQFVEHILMLSTWAACGRAGEPFPDHHLSLDPAPPGNLCSTQDPEIDAHQPRGRLQSLFLLAPHMWLHTQPISDCTSLIPTNFSFTTYFAGYKSSNNPTATSSSPTFDYSLARKNLTLYDHHHDWNFWVNFVGIWTNWGLPTPQLRRPRILSGWFPFWNNLRTRL